jgi:hypothetical protein
MRFSLLALFLVTSLSAAEVPGVGARLDSSDVRLPVCSSVVNITLPPYSAKGDGIVDDTNAIQQALLDTMGQHKIVYLPNGIYKVTKPIKWANQNSQKQNAYGFNWVQGQSTGKTIIRLADNTFRDASKPEAIMWCGGFGSADWFHNYVQNLTFDIGTGNPGAVGLQFYSNNTGSVRDVAIISRDGQGVCGLDLGHRDMNGPLLVRNVSVNGFETGIRSAATVNSQTLEQISVTGFSKLGFANLGQCVSVRGMKVEGPGTAVQAGSFTVLLDCQFTGTGPAKDLPAIQVGPAPFFARNVTTTGYKLALAHSDEKQSVAGPMLEEVAFGKALNPFQSPVKSLGLPVQETPDVTWDDPKNWALAETFGADPTGQKDSSDGIQKAIDSGATTVFIPRFSHITKPIRVRGKVRRIVGSGGWVDYAGKTTPNFVIEDGAGPVSIEHFANINGGIQVNTNRTVIFRSLDIKQITFQKPAVTFFEDVVTNNVSILRGQTAWARQFNIENQGTHLTNDGGTLWVLGYKTEHGGTLLHSKAGARSEIFGNFSYTTSAGKLAPMFRTEDASVYAFFNEVCYSGDPFTTLLSETRKQNTKTLKASEGWPTPYVTGTPKP